MLKSFLLRIVLPTVLTVVLFVVAIYVLLIPALERNVLERKRDMIRELTNSAWNILANLEEEAREGIVTEEEARRLAVRQIKHLHYGMEMKDYFWVNDMTPRMVVHPYRPDLDGKDLSEFTDSEGKRLFVEMVETVRRDGAGFVEYRWPHPDEPNAIAPKISYVKGFEPWGWIIGTGIYLDDVYREIRRMEMRLAGASTLILAVVSAILFHIVRESLRSERERRRAEKDLRSSEERYRTLVESAGESMFMILDGENAFANPSALTMLGYTREEFRLLRVRDFMEDAGDEPTVAAISGDLPESDPARSLRREVVLRRKDGRSLHAMLSCSPIRLGHLQGVIVVATDISEHKRVEERLGRIESRLQQELEDLRNRESRSRAEIQELRHTLLLMGGPGTDAPAPRHAERIARAESPEEACALSREFPELAKTLVDSGLKAIHVNRFITITTDTVLSTLVPFAVRALGPPPAEFAFVVLGSEGRREQTLKTDQDNAICYADESDRSAADTKAYFLKLGGCICRWLDEAGYAPCEGGIMAQNADWCRPLSEWRDGFRSWIRAMEPDALLQTKIAFDFRAAYGNAALVDQLRGDLWQELEHSPRFFTTLAADITQYSPPIGILGNIQLSETPGGRKAVDIKSAMVPIVDFARIYALRHEIAECNTVERIRALALRGILPEQNAEEIIQVYSALMQIRIENQTRNLGRGEPPDNYLDPKTLTFIEQRILRESFSQIKAFQTRLSYDFTGLAGPRP